MYSFEKSVFLIKLSIILVNSIFSSVFSSFKNDFTTYRYPTRFPLSTVEIYLGNNGFFVFILYQLYKCPFHFSRLSILIIIFSIYFVASFLVIYFKSYAEITARSDNPDIC